MAGVSYARASVLLSFARGGESRADSRSEIIPQSPDEHLLRREAIEDALEDEEDRLEVFDRAIEIVRLEDPIRERERAQRSLAFADRTRHQDCAGFTWICESVPHAFQRRAHKGLHHVWVVLDRGLGGDDPVAIVVEARILVGEPHDRFGLDGVRQQRFADRELSDRVDAAGGKQGRQRGALGRNPYHFARINTGGLRIGFEDYGYCAER